MIVNILTMIPPPPLLPVQVADACLGWLKHEGEILEDTGESDGAEGKMPGP